MNYLAKDAMSQEAATVEVVSTEIAEDNTATATPQDEAKAAAPTEAEKEARALKRRVDRLTAERHADRAELEQLRKQKPATQDDGEDKPQLTEADIETRAEQKAREIAEITQINKRCDEIAELGAKESKEFIKAWREVGEELGNTFDARGRPTAVMQAILDADAPHKLILHLAENPDIAGELADMTQNKRIRRIIEIEREMAEEKQPKRSGAPAPVKPVNGGAAASKDPATMSDSEFADWRRASIAKRR